MTIEEQVRDRFIKDTEHHELTIVQDNDLHRHLRFQAPGTWMYGFNIVTWPGYLYIGGDVDDFVFSRVADMFDFFETDPKKYAINPHYWAEKVQSPRRSADLTQRYDIDVLRRKLYEWVDGLTGEDEELRKNLREQVQRQVLDADGVYDSEYAAHLALREFSWGVFSIPDSYEWDLREWDHGYLWVCWALIWGIARYREQTR